MEAVETLGRGRQPNSLYFAVGEINGKLDQLIASLLPRFADLEQVDLDHETRLKSLEVWQARILGGGGVVLFIITSFEVFRVIFPKL